MTKVAKLPAKAPEIPMLDYHGWKLSKQCWDGAHYEPDARFCKNGHKVPPLVRKCPTCGIRNFYHADYGCLDTAICECPCHHREPKPKVKRDDSLQEKLFG